MQRIQCPVWLWLVRILAERGTAPWVKPWKPVAGGNTPRRDQPVVIIRKSGGSQTFLVVVQRSPPDAVPLRIVVPEEHGRAVIRMARDVIE
jgi:hypothetical protein